MYTYIKKKKIKILFFVYLYIINWTYECVLYTCIFCFYIAMKICIERREDILHFKSEHIAPYCYIYQIVFGRVHKNLNGKKNSSRNNRLQRNGNHAIFYSTLEDDKLLDSPSKGCRGYVCEGFPK